MSDVVPERDVTPWWDRWSQTIVLGARHILHDDLKTHHDYAINLNVKDLAAIIDALANQALASTSVDLAGALQEKAPQIAKLNLFAQDFFPGKEVTADSSVQKAKA